MQLAWLKIFAIETDDLYIQIEKKTQGDILWNTDYL
jgi:hypothetical protein